MVILYVSFTNHPGLSVFIIVTEKSTNIIMGIIVSLSFHLHVIYFKKIERSLSAFAVTFVSVPQHPLNDKNRH